MPLDSLSNKELMEQLDKEVKGHVAAKKALVTHIRRQQLIYKHRWHYLNNALDDAEVYNTLLIGASGSGKTHLVNILERITNIPVIYIDGSALNPSSNRTFSAKNIKKMLRNRSYELSYDDPLRYPSEKGTLDQCVVFIDEFDKLGTCFDSSDNWHTKTQSELLDLLENKKEFKFVSFIFAGAFSDLTSRKYKEGLGFNSVGTYEAHGTVTDRDLISCGLMPEIVGRISNIVNIDVLEKEDLRLILDDVLIPKQNTVFQELYSYDISDSVPEDVKQAMVDTAYDSGQNVRALKRELFTHLKDIEFSLQPTIPEQELPGPTINELCNPENESYGKGLEYKMNKDSESDGDDND